MKLAVRMGVVTGALAVGAVAVLSALQLTPLRPAATSPAQSASAAAKPGLAPLPPLNTAGYVLARPLPLTRAVYEFAARHPEVSRYVPCYCGCEADGHRSNEACFIGARDANGNVTAWDTHGFGCAVCVDVARDAMQLFNSGADPASIRSAIERKWTPQYTTKTPTPPCTRQEALKRVVDDRAAAFARLFEAVHEGVYIGLVGPSTTTTLAANPHLKLVLGYPPDAIEREVRPFDAVRFADEQARTAFLERLSSAGSVADYLLRLRRADGSAVWLEVTATADPADASGAMRIEALVRDVSERKHLEDQSRDLYYQLLQTEKMAALGQTISGVAHELNNPLATILSWAERLSQRAQGDDALKRGLDVILSESERAARIVRNLLTFARKRQSTRALVDLNQIVRETLGLRAYEQRITNITVISALAAGLPAVFADGHQVKQVLLNLLMNAEQAMLGAHGRGTIVIRTWHDGAKQVVVLEVNDDGPGVAEDVQGKIFDPFFTTKEVGKGTGLGLTVAYAIVQEHGGRITLKSQRGAGASFFVELPVSGGKAVSQRRSQTTPVAPTPNDVFKGARVLIVEDEPALATAVKEAFTDAGFVVDRAGDGEEGLARVAQNHYDLIVCDLKMPRVDGIRFYRAMTAATPALARRVIFVTGDVAGTDAERFLEESGCRWLSKPFRLGDLLRAAREALA